jgi:hypothetical protein
MDAKDILRIAGQIAGLGGLALAVLLIIYRQVLLSIKSPEKIPAKGYLETINRMILYVFIVALVGLVLFAILSISEKATAALSRVSEVERELGTVKVEHAKVASLSERLAGENNTLSNRLARIEEASLKEQMSGLEMLSQDVSFDVQEWKAVDPNQRLTEKVYPVKTRKRFRLIRASKEAVSFSSTFGTSSPFEPNFASETHKFSVKRNTDLIPPGKPALRRWILTFDISEHALFEPFVVEEVVTVYNSFPNPQRESCGTLITVPTQQASIEVVFPTGKLPDTNSFQFSFYTLATSQPPTPLASPKFVYVAEKRSLKWTIDKPRLAHHYQAEWNW